MIKNIFVTVGIHNGGGLTFLLLIQDYLDKKNNFLILDRRIKNKVPKFKSAKVIFLKKGPLRNLRILYWRIYYKFIFIRNNNKLIKENDFLEFYLNGFPPFFRLPFFKNKTYIFCQNKLVFDNLLINQYFNLPAIKILIYIFIHKICFFIFKKKKDILIVQTNSMKRKLMNLNFKNKIILHDEFWNLRNNQKFKMVYNLSKYELSENKFINKIRKTYKKNIIFFYPANYAPHKNHKNLIKAFENINMKNFSYKLILTLTTAEIKYLNIKNTKNIILFEKINLKEIYNSFKFVDYLIYPSISESYGLPLIEAKFNSTKIIASDLEYVYEVCKPYLVFNPFSIEDISKKLIYSIQINNRIKNKIN